MRRYKIYYYKRVNKIIILLIIVVNKAWKTLENEETRSKCMDVIEEAKARTDHMVNTWLHVDTYNSLKSNVYNAFRWFLRLIMLNVVTQIAEKKKKLKKEGKSENSGPTHLEEETEEGYRHAVWVMTMKLFADMERRR